MNKGSIYFKILVFSLITVFSVVFFAKNVEAWNGCCSPSSQWSGTLWNGCCYSGGGGNNCCSLGDAIASGCEGLIPCPNCVPDDPPCEECTLGNCPAPLTNTGDPAYRLSNYRSCQNGQYCDDGWKYGDCYETPSPQPTSSIQIFPTGNPTQLGCTSSTHTGIEVNNPIRMVSTHTDPDGSSDIEAIYIWLKIDGAIPNTPQYIDLDSSSGQTGRTYTRNSYGFMMHREGANWVPYIPSLVGGGNDKWIKATYGGGRFAIKGPSSQDMVFVQVNGVSEAGNSVNFDFNLDFRNISEVNRVIEGSYNIFVMANDVFGFTPYDNYGPGVTKIGDYFNPEQIRFYQNWTDSNRDWVKDFTPPVVNAVNSEVTGPTKIKFSWNIGDLLGIFGLVGNTYLSDGVTESENITQVVLTSDGNKTVVTPYLPQPQGNSTIGHMSNGYIARAVNVGGVSKNGSLEMNVGGNREGSLLYYVTAFDNACNYNQSYSLYNLEGWIITYGGLMYSSTGVDFAVKNVEDPALWNPVALLNKISPAMADLSTELYGTGLSNPTVLTKSNTTKSFSVSPFKAYRTVDFYSDVKNTFERREVGISGVQRLNPNTSTLTGSLGAGGIKVLDRSGNLTVGDANPFVCNGKGLFFVSGNLVVNNKILNSNYNHDACIFVVAGNVVINPGANSSGGSVGYDEINAYILTNGSVTLNTDPTFDGLYVSGGIQSLGGIFVDRYLGLNYRNTHPLLVVNHHSKYGIFSSTLIGNPIDMVKVEVGFKPF
ncbi:hypothetical protein CVU76_03015 [Candidatus Dojkabacteria bacterium HGW-Dojkabacteria-1]|uniref:Uncharacterized protein n=1 Tax=Candidatus Dojkabacteria bacterium HGW-Dojkabacteria-1 TaxID=2013761 RepID=A0A2N2F434_9BACT|nr:MAG: hypothetical protein CVU76_03015 [Candidatus Dojkabacteria bacterium HGW-Dojkabacteria-1]